MRRIVLSLLAIAATTARLQGQSFEVAMIKPTPSENAGPVEPSIVQFLPNGFRRTNSTLRTLVRTAYDIQEFQVIGGPGWTDTLRFDVEARFDGTFARDQVLRMLQTLLSERLRLKVRRETREGDIFALTVAAGGSKLKPAVASTSASVRIGSYLGARRTSQLAQYLASVVGRPVEDRTGLDGIFEMELTFAGDVRDTERPSLAAALQEQLGLRLDSARGPIETLVIESAEMPSGN
jgi:uncharacterized protein (TIGR03435 family)